MWLHFIKEVKILKLRLRDNKTVTKTLCRPTSLHTEYLSEINVGIDKFRSIPIPSSNLGFLTLITKVKGKIISTWARVTTLVRTDLCFLEHPKKSRLSLNLVWTDWFHLLMLCVVAPSSERSPRCRPLSVVISRLHFQPRPCEPLILCFPIRSC